jgi:hypothetical protein
MHVRQVTHGDVLSDYPRSARARARGRNGGKKQKRHQASPDDLAYLGYMQWFGAMSI